MMKFFLIMFLLSAFDLLVLAETRVTKEKIIRYRQNQEVDLSGSTVAGKIRTPEIFYIFQRKRSEGEDFLQVPTHLQHQRQQSWSLLQTWSQGGKKQ